MKTIGICSSTTLDENNSKYNYEITSLIKEAKANFSKVFVLNPLRISYQIDPTKSHIKLIHKREDISNLSALIIRSTRSIETATSLLVNALNINNCKIIDPIDRFIGAKASKLITTLTRFEKNVGAASYFSFTENDAIDLLQELEKDNQFPVIFKPVAGSKGAGILKSESFDSAKRLVQDFFESSHSNDLPLFFQRYINYTNEYRVMIIGGSVIGIVEKHKKNDSLVANASKGAEFEEIKDDQIGKFVQEHVSNEGILGVDIARDNIGTLYIIEANRAPQWYHFEKATGINVANKIINYVIERIHQQD